MFSGPQTERGVWISVAGAEVCLQANAEAEEARKACELAVSKGEQELEVANSSRLRTEKVQHSTVDAVGVQHSTVDCSGGAVVDAVMWCSSAVVVVVVVQWW